MDGIIFSKDGKFDLQLSQALVNERRLGELFAAAKLEKIEVKSETWQWEQTGNICIEYKWNGKLSGLAATEADYWVHELKRDGETLCYLMFPAKRLKELARKAWHEGRLRSKCGDGEQSSVVLIPLREILK